MAEHADQIRLIRHGGHLGVFRAQLVAAARQRHPSNPSPAASIPAHRVSLAARRQSGCGRHTPPAPAAQWLPLTAAAVQPHQFAASRERTTWACRQGKRWQLGQRHLGQGKAFCLLNAGAPPFSNSGAVSDEGAGPRWGRLPAGLPCTPRRRLRRVGSSTSPWKLGSMRLPPAGGVSALAGAGLSAGAVC